MPTNFVFKITNIFLYTCMYHNWSNIGATFSGRDTHMQGEEPSESKQKQSLKGWDYAIILVVFAVTGSTAAIFPKWLMPLTGIEEGAAYYMVYFVLITPIYQVLLLGYAFIFGKFDYFWDKQKKIGRWIWRKITGKPKEQ